MFNDMIGSIEFDVIVSWKPRIHEQASRTEHSISTTATHSVAQRQDIPADIETWKFMPCGSR